MANKEHVNEIHYTICPVGNAGYIATNKDDFLKKGLEAIGVKPIRLQTLEKELWATHYTHENKLLFREGGNIPPLWTRSRGTETVLLGLTTLWQKQYILARADSDLNCVSQLRNRKIGIPSRPGALIDFPKASAEHGFKIALSAKGITFEEVETVDISSPGNFHSGTADKIALGKAETDALESGEVDAIFAKTTFSQKLLDTGKYKVLFEIHAHPDFVSPINNGQPNTLTVSRYLAENRPDIVTAFVKQVLLAAEWAKSNYAEVLQLFAKQTFGTPGQVSAAFIRGFHENLTPNLSEKNLLLLEGQKRFLYDRGYLEKDFSLEEWADDSFLKAAWAEIESER